MTMSRTADPSDDPFRVHRAAAPNTRPQLPLHLREALRHVLANLTYPAQRWQVLAHAVHWGASPAFCAVLAHLPERVYHSPGAIHSGLSEVNGDGPAGSTPREPSPPAALAHAIWATSVRIRPASPLRHRTRRRPRAAATAPHPTQRDR